MITITRVIFIALIFVIYYLSDFQLISKFDQKRETGSARDWPYTFVVWILAIFITLQPILLPDYGIDSNIILIIIGLAFSLLGLFLNRWARLHLGHLFFEGEEIQNQHYLVNTGPYQYIRHPIYLSIILISFGILIINSSIFMVLLFIYTIIDFSRAAARDEKILSINLLGYKKYMKNTPRFFPKLFR